METHFLELSLLQFLSFAVYSYFAHKKIDILQKNDVTVIVIPSMLRVDRTF